MKAAYLAAIAVAIIAIVGVGAYVLLSNNGDNGGSSEEPIRTDLKVGDFIERNIVGSTETETVKADQYTEGFLQQYLYGDYTGDKAGQETLKIGGKDVACDIYKTETEDLSLSYWVSQGSDIVCKIAGKIGGLSTDTLLLDTNLDLTKPIEEQTVANGSFVKQNVNIPDLGKGIRTATVSNLGEETCTVTEVMAVDISVKEKETIKAIDGNEITLDDDTKESVDEFLSGISYKSYVKSLEDKKVTYGSKTSETIDTEFGKKKVTAQEMTVINDDGKSESFTVYYASNDVVYRIDMKDVKSDIVSTSLVKL